MSTPFERFLKERKKAPFIAERKYPSIMHYVQALQNVQRELESMSVEMLGTGLSPERDKIIHAIGTIDDVIANLQRLKGFRR